MIVGAERRMEGGCEDAFTVSVLRKWKETRASEPLEDCGTSAAAKQMASQETLQRQFETIGTSILSVYD